MMVAFTHGGQPRMLYCGKWSCKHCRAQNAKDCARDARYGITHGNKENFTPVFWTLTLGKPYYTAKQGYAALPRLWDALRKALQRAYGKICYLAFVEGQALRNGMPHFHVIIYARVPQGYSKRRDRSKWIKDFAVAMGFGHQAEEKPITSDGAAQYVAKYVSKSTPYMPKGFRRVRYSRNWVRAPRPVRQPYVVRSIGEPIEAYILRVEEISGRDVDDLIKDYQSASIQMQLERLDAS